MRRPVSNCEASDISPCGTRQETKNHCNKHYDQIRRYGKARLTVADSRSAITDDLGTRIPLGINAKFGYALIDKEDSWVDEYNWSKTPTGYAQARVDGTVVLMHQLIMGKKYGLEIDHININHLDNRRSNLRYVTHAENMYNLPLAKNNRSGARGVNFDRRKNKWRAQIQKDGRNRFIGYFNSIGEAKKARKGAEERLFVYR